jgi:hypothetical protein
MCRKREVTSPEEFNAEVGFQLPDSVTDGAGRYTQLVGSTGCAPQPCNSLKGDKALDGGYVLNGHSFYSVW